MSSSVDRWADLGPFPNRSPPPVRVGRPREVRRTPPIEAPIDHDAPFEDERETERSRRNRFIFEGLRQLALSVVIVLLLGVVSVRIFASLGPNTAGDGANLAPQSDPTTKAAEAPVPVVPRLEAEVDASTPAGRPALLRLKVSDPPEGSTIVISGLAPGAALSAGETREVEWRLGLADLSDLSVIPPKDFVGDMSLVVELRRPRGDVAGRRVVRLEWTGAAAADRGDAIAEAEPASSPPPSAPSEAPRPATAAQEAAPAAEIAGEKQVARAVAEPAETPAKEEAAAARAEPKESDSARMAPCFAKLDGKVVLNGPCRIAWTERKSVTFEAGDKRLSVTLDHGGVWRLQRNGEDMGKIYRRGDCWGSKTAYVCEHGL